MPEPLVAGLERAGTFATAAAGFRMEAFLAHWWVFPASVLFATVALAAGVSGALFSCSRWAGA